MSLRAVRTVVTLRPVARLALTASTSIAPRSTIAIAPAPRIFQPLSSQIRFHSVPASKTTTYKFQQIQHLASNPSEDRVLIDVREPSEVQGGYIPSAINIPVASQADALLLPDEEFEDRFGFPKPDLNKEVIFYCKAGVRSSAAASLAGQGGYKRIGEYKGSWLDWQKHGGAVEKP